MDSLEVHVLCVKCSSKIVGLNGWLCDRCLRGYQRYKSWQRIKQRRTEVDNR
jgi:hypothetical protein